ncbi:MAG: DegT/DnrJ/EryC1/StrS family aminotransferase [Lachnospiraceae bacterium]|nr:DegT/DnrJ/EryC1/StrS family aminotransferase [Lachnospiraceae bacterium]
MNVDFVSLKRNYELYKAEYDEAVKRAVESGWYILGKELESFEAEFAAYLGVKHCIGVNSGTDALILSVRALGIGPGDEVIVPAGAYIASILGVTENGATPVYVDSDEFHLIDVSKIEAAITPRTKAILPVHMYGQASNMAVIADVAKRHGLRVIEDCAQCHGSTWDGKLTGTWGDIGCFSFYPTKPLGAFGDGGALVTDDDELADKLRLLRNYGSRVKYRNEIVGVNTRLDELQSAILKVGLKHITDTNRARAEIADIYLNGINNPAIELPKVASGATHVFHLFPILTEKRDEFVTYIKENGIGTQIHYPIPPYAAECYRDQGHELKDFPEAARVADHEVSLPIYAAMTRDEAGYVVKIVNNWK